MKDSLKVARWETKRLVKSKVFLVITFIIPLVILLIGGVVGYFSSRNTLPDTFILGVIDETGVLGKGIENKFAEKNYEVKFFDRNLKDKINKIIKKEKLDGFLLIPETVFKENQIDYYFKDLLGLNNDLIINTVNPLIIDMRLKNNGYSPEEIYSLTKSVHINEIPIEESGKSVSNIGSMFIPFGLAILMVFASMFSGGTLMQSIIKEKSNRIVELILSSISSKSLMTGKVIAYGVLGLIQISIWSISAILLIKFFFDISLTPLLNVKTLYMFIYFLLGFILTASINAIAGAGMKEAQSASQSTGLLVIIPIIPIYFASAIIRNPEGILSKVLTYLPFTTPTTMLLRLGFSSPGIIEIILTIFILIITNYFLLKLAAKIFRIGMLMYGKNASFKELFRWARSRDY
jgi:ABC-2 type transport system permease protein